MEARTGSLGGIERLSSQEFGWEKQSPDRSGGLQVQSHISVWEDDGADHPGNSAEADGR